MLELKALASFINICQQPSLTRAAEKSGIAASSLSETLKGLEGEIGFTLFDRKSKGLIPTEAASWLYRYALNVLHAESFLRRAVKAGVEAPRSVEIRVQLPFAIGLLSQAISVAVEKVGNLFPDVCFRVCWQEDVYRRAEGQAGIPADNIIELRYQESDGIAPAGAEQIFSDRLLLVRAGSRLERQIARPLQGQIVVPRMAARLQHQFDNAEGLKRLESADLIASSCELAALSALEAEFPDATFLIPASAVAERHIRVQPSGADSNLDVAPVPVIATVRSSEPAAARFVEMVRDQLANAISHMTLDPRITVRQLGYFDFLQQTGSVTGAARLAAVTQPAVTDQLGKLELNLGEALFHRSRSGLELTKAGARFLVAGGFLNAALTDLKLARPQAAASTGGRIALGILPSVGPYGFLISRFTHAVLAWRARYPHLSLRIIEEPNTALQERIIQGTLDLGVITTKSPRLARFDLKSSEMLSLIVNAKHDPITDKEGVDFKKLTELPMVLPTIQFGLRQLIDSAGRERGLVIRPEIEVESLSMCVALVRGSALCTILPASDVQNEIQRGELRSYVVESPNIVRTLQIIYSAKRALTQAERDLVELLRIHLNTDEVQEM